MSRRLEVAVANRFAVGASAFVLQMMTLDRWHKRPRSPVSSQMAHCRVDSSMLCLLDAGALSGDDSRTLAIGDGSAEASVSAAAAAAAGVTGVGPATQRALQVFERAFGAGLAAAMMSWVFNDWIAVWG